MDLYTPSPEAIEQLKRCTSAARVELFYGSWCPFCRRHVPRLLKALEDAGQPVSIRIVAVPRRFTQQKDAADRGVTRVPTLIAYDGPQEVGRLQGQDWSRPEEALVRILPIAPAPSASGSR
jgi:thiol-disulfide isomerase/thioredoxin